MKTRVALSVRKSLPGCAGLLVALALLFHPSSGASPRAQAALAGEETKAKTEPARAAAAQPLEDAYTKKIREFTTEPYFLTELVDHLPASATVPTPEKVLGYAIGTPGKLTYTKDTGSAGPRAPNTTW